MDNEIEQSKLGTFMGNSAARASYLDVRSPEGSSRHVGDSGTEQQQPGKKGLASKAGIIIGIHNIFIVMPQFVITAISSIIFAVMSSGAPEQESPGDTGGNHTVPDASTIVELSTRAAATARGGGPNAYAIVFRLGGVAAIVAFVLTVRLARHLRHQ
ncbi:hypothetical protein PHLCEN_2v1779 [Hermanssonia centrifuga]|uniref:Uncharacterized protein n=1 Tax=Hermanssonia centrifuga TaxID=98765 RepID=A0A2R6RVV5_9APHY|nr:hypothetical protein PHLCEN_2v1779 [Hermanssonia centrifuga]